jgi:acyl-CoA thioester hydrolase
VTKPIGRREEYSWFTPITTRWMDNDAYGHVNNVIYYSWFDTAVARFLIGEVLPVVPEGDLIGFVVETQCRYHAPIAFPDDVTVGLRVERLGTSSVRYGIGIFRNEDDRASAEGHFVHVHVTKDTGRPRPTPLEARAALERFMVARG